MSPRIEQARHTRRLMMLGVPLLMAGCARTASSYAPSEHVQPVVDLEKGLPPLPVRIYLPSFSPALLARLPAGSVRQLAGEILPRSPIVRSALYAVAQASEGVAEADAKRGFHLDAQVGAGTTDTDGVRVTRNRPTVLGGLQGGFTIWDNGAGTLREGRARWAVAASVSQLWERVEAVCFNVCEAAYSRSKALAVLKLSNASVSAFEGTLRAVRAQVETGLSPLSDIPEAEARLERIRASGIATHATLEDAETHLQRVVGRRVIPVLDLQPFAPPAGTPEERAASHPSVLAADCDIRVAIKDVLEVDAERLGSLALGFGPSGFLSAFGGGGVWSLGTAFVRASIPLFDSGERHARLRSAVAALEIALAKRQDGFLAVAASIREAETAVRAALGTEAAATREGKATERLLAQKLADWRAGTSDLRVILDAQQAKWDSLERAEAARWDRKIADIRVLATSGLLARMLGVVDGESIDMLSDQPMRLATTLLRE